MSALTPRPGILKIAPYVPGKDSIEGKQTIAKLSSNEGALGPSPKAMAAYAKAAAELHRYPDGASERLRQAIGRHYGLDAKRIICGSGSDELLNLLVRAYCGPGDELLYSQFGFLMYPINALGAGATPVAAPEKDYRADVDAMLARVSDKTRVICLANPNNPTGSYVTKDDVRRLQAALPRNVLLVIDAAYAEYVSRNDYESGVELVDQAENVVMTRTFSKIYGMGGLRLGWMYGPAGVIDVMSRFRQPVLVETFLPGREFTVGMIGTGRHAESIAVLEVLLTGRAEADVYGYVNKEECESRILYRQWKPCTGTLSAGFAHLVG